MVSLGIKLETVIGKTLPVRDYVMNMEKPFKDRFMERMETYRLDEDVVEELKKYKDDIWVIVFSAEWCKDCAANVPVLALLADKAGLNVRVFGHLIRDTLNPKEKWRIPPSPPEVREFKVGKIPHIVVLNTKGEEFGEIIENPTPEKTLEEEILQLVKNGLKRA